MPRLIYASFVGAALVGCTCSARPGNAMATDGIRCPSTLRTTQSATDSTMPWSATQQGESSRLLYIEVYAGPWRNEQAVPPDEVQDSPGRQTLVWHLRGRPSANGTFLVCTYLNTQVKLERRLPDSVTGCRLVNSTDPKRVMKVLEHGCG